MQDLIRPDSSISPREIFARMQGAWFEPRQGYMWQENTGVTATTSGGQTIGKLVDLSADRVASQATAANRPLLGARRNLLTYSEQFDNAAWTQFDLSVSANSVVAPDGTGTADALSETATNAAHVLRYQIQALTNQYYTFSVDVKQIAGSRYALLCLYNTAIPLGVNVSVDLSDGTYTVFDGNPNGYLASAAVTPLPGGWYRCSLTKRTQAPGTLAGAFGFSNSKTPNTLFPTYLGNVGNTLAYWGAQLELGSTATDYQRITTATDYDAGRFPAIRHADSSDVLTATLPDLGSGVFSSAGSVYFSTPVGMSCLHNQSIGTSYNLPALQTDIYGTVITPARLAPPLEQRLALYMHRLAGLADADFFWQEQATDGMTGQLLADDNDTILLRA